MDNETKSEKGHDKDCCRDMAHTMQMKFCKDEDCRTSAGVDCQLCPDCAKKKGVCEHCLKDITP